MTAKNLGLKLIEFSQNNARNYVPPIGALSNYLTPVPATRVVKEYHEDDDQLNRVIRRMMGLPFAGPFGSAVAPRMGPLPIPGLLR